MFIPLSNYLFPYIYFYNVTYLILRGKEKGNEGKEKWKGERKIYGNKVGEMKFRLRHQLQYGDPLGSFPSKLIVLSGLQMSLFQNCLNLLPFLSFLLFVIFFKKACLFNLSVHQ